MKESVVVLLAFLTIVGCGNRNGNNTNVQETLESNKFSYPDIVNFIAKGYQCGWEGMDFFEKGNLRLSSGPAQKGWQIEGAERVKMKGDGWNDSHPTRKSRCSRKPPMMTV